MLSVFKATLPSVNYIFKNGKPAIFVSGRYTTSVEAEIKELNEEVAAGHPHISIDPNEREISSELVDPIAALRHKIIAEYKATELSATNPSNDMGQSIQGALIPGNTTNIAEAAAGGNGQNTSALTFLKAPIVIKK
jgi:hypothetical protein